MTEMIPATIPKDAVSGEKKVFSVIQNAKGSENWICLHSLDIFGDINHGQGESDFVLLVPGHGILVIEVKSHPNVAHIGGQWYLNGVSQQRGPVKQASNNTYAIINELKSQNVSTKTVPIGFAVWFPNAPKINLPPSPEWRSWMFLFEDDTNTNVTTSLKKILTETRKGIENQRGKFPELVSSSGSLRRISKCLRPDFVVQKNCEQRKNDVMQSISMATTVQRNLLDQLETLSGERLITGLAGTGKSFLATTDAKRSHQNGDKTPFLCFNRHLAKKMEAELSPYKLITVRTIHSLMLQVSGLDKAPENVTDQWWRNELPELASESIINGSFHGEFDHVVIDEGQDIGTSAYLDFIDLFRYQHENQGKLTVYGDFENQGIYLDGSKAELQYKKKFPRMQKLFTLRMNCRNTREVGSTVQELCGNRFEFSDFLRGDQGPMPGLHKYTNESDLKKNLSSQLKKLIHNYGEEEVVILSSERVRLMTLLGELQIKARSLDDPGGSGLRYSTTFEFKGLEAMSVVLVEFDDSSTANQDTFYVAGTRSLSSFHCYFPEKLRKRLFQKRELT